METVDLWGFPINAKKKLDRKYLLDEQGFHNEI